MTRELPQILKRIVLACFLMLGYIDGLTQPSITAFSPESGPIGTTVIISGAGFDNDPANNVVFFGATRATVTAATASELTVSVPSGASYEPITVLVDNLIAHSDSPFAVTFEGGVPISADSFMPGDARFIGLGASKVVVGDLDGDGKPDIAVLDQFKHKVSVLRNMCVGAKSFYAQKKDFSTGTSPMSAALGDLDGDGKKDIAVANHFGHSVSILRNTTSEIGAISFAEEANLTFGQGIIHPTSVAIHDLDGDGKDDIAVTRGSNATVTVFRNISSEDGTISFAAQKNFVTDSWPNSVAISDLDGDRKPELVVANRGSNTLSVFRNTSTNGQVTFQEKQSLLAGTSPLFVSIGDIDRDEKLDLVVSNGGETAFTVFKNTSAEAGSISFNSGVSYQGGSSRPVLVGDLDGDAKVDLAVGSSVFKNTSNEETVSFSNEINLGTGPLLSISDMDGDGKNDLLTAGVGNVLVVYRNALASDIISFSVPSQNELYFIGNGQVTIEVENGTDLTSLISTFTLSPGATASVNGIQQTSGSTPNDFTEPTTYTVTANDGVTKQDWTVTIVPAPAIPSITSLEPTRGPIGELVTISGSNFGINPSDNIVFFGGVKAEVLEATPTSLEIVVPQGASYQPITVTVNGVTAYSSVPFEVTFESGGVIDQSSFSNQTIFGTGNHPTHTAIGDFDGDGKNDIVAVNYSSHSVSVLRNTSETSGMIRLADKLDFATGRNPGSISLGDLDGDGKLDMAIINLNSNEINSSVSILRNVSSDEGAIGLKYERDYLTGAFPLSVSMGDLDGDGRSDLAWVNTFGSKVSTLRNTRNSTEGNGATSFIGNSEYTVGGYTQSVTIGDLNGDGKADLAVTDRRNNTVSILTNVSSGAGATDYSESTSYPTGLEPSYVAIGDLDGDENPDLAVSNRKSNTVSIFRNTGDPDVISFETRLDFPTGNYPTHVSMSDLDGDGKTDLAIANYSSNTISLLKNTSSQVGAIGFAPKVDYETGTRPSSISIGDLDGNGKVDLVVDNSGSSNISVFRNLIGASSATDILTFNFPEQTISSLDNENHRVSIEVTSDADVTSLTPIITVDEGAIVSPSSGVAQDFSSPVVYTVTAEDASTKQNWAVTVNQIPLSLGDIEDIDVFPNPATNHINIKKVRGNYTVQILTLSGKTVYNEPNKRTIKVSEFPKGIYLLKILTGHGEPKAVKVIKK